MDLFDVIRICVRRWYIFLPLLIAASGYAYNLYSSVQPVYYANSVLTIAAPNQKVAYGGAGESIGVNGLLEVGGPNLITNIAVISCNADPALRGRVVARGGTPNFVIKNFPTATGTQSNGPLPLVMVETTQSDLQTAKKTVELAAVEIGPCLQAVQRNAGVPESVLVKAIPVSAPVPIKAFPSRTRGPIGILVGGLLLAVLASVTTDALVNLRSRQKTEGAPTSRESTGRGAVGLNLGGESTNQREK